MIKHISVRHMDYLGSLLLLSGSILLIFSLQEAGTLTYSWGSSVIISCTILSLVSWIGLFTWQYYLTFVHKTTYIVPVFPLRLLTRRVMGTGIL